MWTVLSSQRTMQLSSQASSQMIFRKPHVQYFSNAKNPGYYLYVKDRTCSTTAPITEYIPIAEYLFRYDRWGFWVGWSAFEYFRFHSIDSRDSGSTISSARGCCTRPSTRAPCLKTTMFKTSHFPMPQLKNSSTTRPSPLVYGCSDYVHCAEVPCLLSIFTFPKRG